MQSAAAAPIEGGKPPVQLTPQRAAHRNREARSDDMTGIRRNFLREGVTIRTYLLALVLAAVIPLGAFVAALLYVISSKQEAEMERAVLESAEALAAAIESNIDSGLKRMAVLANESSLHVGNIDQFAQRCREAVGGSPDWRSLLLSAPDGTSL